MHQFIVLFFSVDIFLWRRSWTEMKTYGRYTFMFVSTNWNFPSLRGCSEMNREGGKVLSTFILQLQSLSILLRNPFLDNFSSSSSSSFLKNARCLYFSSTKRMNVKVSKLLMQSFYIFSSLQGCCCLSSTSPPQ